MKRVLLGLLTLLALAMLASPAGAVITPEWDAAFGGPDADAGYDVQPTSDGGAIAAGFGGQGNLLANLVVKTDGLGQLQWQRTFSLNNYGGRAYGVVETNDGGYVVFASTYLPSAVDNRPWLIKLDADGNTLWSSENGLTQQVTVDSAIIRGFERADGSLVIVGGTNSFTNVQRPWVATASASGVLQSFAVYPSLATGYGEGTYIEDIAPTPDGGFVLVGGSSPPLPGRAFLWKFGADLEPAWVQIYDDIFVRVAFGVEVASDGGYLLTGCEVANCTDAVLVKTDSQGEVVWSQRYNLPLYSEGRDVIERPGGGYLLLQTSVDAAGSTSYTTDLLELDVAGELIQATPVQGGVRSTHLTRLRAVDGGFVAVGSRDDSAGYPNVDLYLFKGAWDAAGSGLLACPDFDGSQWVDVGDLAQITAHWQNHSASPEWNPIFDRNGDEMVDLVDILLVGSRWGEYCGP
jgi:hypothetical protein